MFIYKIIRDVETDEGFLQKEQEYICSDKEYSIEEFDTICKEAEKELIFASPQQISENLIKLFGFKSIDEYIKINYYCNHYETGENNYVTVNNIADYNEKLQKELKEKYNKKM